MTDIFFYFICHECRTCRNVRLLYWTTLVLYTSIVLYTILASVQLSILKKELSRGTITESGIGMMSPRVTE